MNDDPKKSIIDYLKKSGMGPVWDGSPSGRPIEPDFRDIERRILEIYATRDAQVTFDLGVENFPTTLEDINMVNVNGVWEMKT